MEKEVAIFLQHILESIQKIERYTRKVTWSKFQHSSQLQDSVLKRLENIGEAIKNIPAEFTGKYPDIPWRDMARLRDKLIHGYFDINAHIVWEVVQKDLPPLKSQIVTLLKKLSPKVPVKNSSLR